MAKAQQYLQALQTGANIGSSFQQAKMTRDIFEREKSAEEEAKEREMAAAKDFQSIFQSEAQKSQGRAAGAEVLSQMRTLAKEPPSVRKANAPILFKQFEKKFGRPIAENVQQMIVQGKTEEVMPVIDNVIADYTHNPNMTVEEVSKILSDPAAAAQITGRVSRETSSQISPKERPKVSESQRTIQQLQNRIQQAEKVIAKHPNTKIAGFAEDAIDRWQGQLQKMNRFLSPDELSSQGFTPGTVAVQTGVGEVKTLQQGQGNTRTAVIEGFEEPQAVIERSDGRLFFQDGRPVPMNKVRGFLGVVRQETEDAPTLGGAITKAGAQKEREGRIERANMRERLISLFKTAQDKAEGATGLKGLLSEKVGGLAGQIPVIGSEVENELTQAISGMSPEEIQEFRTEAQSMIGPMIPLILNDTSGRYSDRDLERVEETQQAMNPTASPRQVVSALKTLTQTMFESDLRYDYLQGVKPRVDVLRRDGASKYVSELMETGFSKEEALDSLRRNLEFLKRKGLFSADARQ